MRTNLLQPEGGASERWLQAMRVTGVFLPLLLLGLGRHYPIKVVRCVIGAGKSNHRRRGVQTQDA